MNMILRGEVGSYKGQKMVLESSEMMQFQLVVSCPVSMMGPHSGPLERQKALYTAEASLQLPKPGSEEVKNMLVLFFPIANISCVLHCRLCFKHSVPTGLTLCQAPPNHHH